jgi:hypothetical protein
MSRKTKTDKPAVPPFDPAIEGKIVTKNTKTLESTEIPDEAVAEIDCPLIGYFLDPILELMRISQNSIDSETIQIEATS